MPQRRSLADRVTDSFRVLTELDLSHAYERQAGTIALIVIAVVAAAAMILVSATAGPARQTVAMEFPSAGGLAGGDPVLVRGARVGRVRKVELVGPGRVRVTTTLDADLAPRRDAGAEILALDMVGNQAVNYHPGVADEPLPADAAVPGIAGRTMAGQMGALREQAAELAVRLRGIDPAVFRDDLARTQAALARARAATQGFPEDPLTTAVDELLERGLTVLGRLDSVQAAFPGTVLAAQRDSLAASASVLMDEVGQVQSTLAAMRERVGAGEGNVGKLQRDSAFRTELDGARLALRRLQETLLGRKPPPTRVDSAGR
jgi:phospholipid/cholesterol/gamma-HCH transport system substrate-binding protein